MTSIADLEAKYFGKAEERKTTKAGKYERPEYPYKLSEVIGNPKAVKLTEKTANNNAVHLLFTGRPGTGKSLLSELTAVKRESPLFRIEASGLTSEQIQQVITEAMANEKSVIFIDEIHSLKLEVEEKLYSAIQDKKFHMIKDNKTSVIDLPDDMKFLGATTLIGQVSEPLRRRMAQVMVHTYNDADLSRIIKNLYAINKSALDVLVSNCDGTPRLAKLICLIANDGDKKNKISKADVELTLDLLDIVDGLTYNQREILSILAQNKEEQKRIGKRKFAMGAKLLANMIKVDVQELESEIEPILFDKGLITVTSGGRIITQEGEEYVGLR